MGRLRREPRQGVDLARRDHLISYANIGTLKQQSLYTGLSLILVELPVGLIGLVLFCGGCLAATYAYFLTIFAWGAVPPLAHIPFVSGGIAFMALSKLSHRIIAVVACVALGIAIIALGMQTGALDGSIMDASFEFGDSIGLILIGITCGLLIGIGFKFMANLFQDERMNIQAIMIQNHRRWILSFVLNFLFLWLFIEYTLSGSSLGLAILAGTLAGLAFGGFDLLHYIIARCVLSFTSSNLVEP